ncbi:ComEC/Rec2 family competence protein, partial [Pirellulales bacterium]|nr:ComEC/Rec2 family competence protein [Pirellulales bacterium]
AAAALVVLAVNPSELFRSGTQLSFLSVVVLVRFGQFLNRSAERDPLDRLLAEARPWAEQAIRGFGVRFGQLALASLVVWLVTAPLVAYHFHLSTPGGIAVSPLIWPLVAAAIASGAAAVAVGWAIPPLGALLGGLCGGCLHATQTVVQYAQSYRWGYFFCAGPAAWWLAGFYGAIALATAFPRWRPSGRWQASILAVWMAVGLINVGGLRRNGPAMRCTFLAMGHGTCAVLELPGGQTLLYDAGSLGSPETGGRTVASFLWSRQISHIDAIVVSHADIDHYNAVPTLLEMFSVGALYVSPMMFDGVSGAEPDAATTLLDRAATEFGVPRIEIDKNDPVEIGDSQVEIRVLHPPPQGVEGRDNANSLVLAIDYGGHRVLLPGDLESAGLEALTSGPPLDADVLLAPHHGSAGSDPPGFAAWCRPEWVVVSGSSGNRTKVATRSYQQAGARVLNTSDDGAAEFMISPAGIRARTYR